MVVSTPEDRLPVAGISQHQVFTLSEIFRGVVIPKRDSIFVSIGDGSGQQLDLDRLEVVGLGLATREQAALVHGQEVESQNKTRRATV
jgi:hypothetical protein